MDLMLKIKTLKKSSEHKKLGVGKIFKNDFERSLLCSPGLHLLDVKKKKKMTI